MKYELLVQSQHSCRLFYLHPAVYDPHGEVPIGLLQRLIMDAAATAGFLHLRTGHFADALISAWRFFL